MLDLWDTNPDHVFSTPDRPPEPPLRSHDDHPNEVVLKITAAGFACPPTS